MLISLDWLKQYVDIKEDIKELENTLTMIGQEVEAIEEQGAHLENVVVGQIVEYGKHPDSDKLTLLKVNVGEPELLQIICGAPNHRLNDKIIVAKVGAVLPGDFKIKKSKIRGLESQGMCCSEKELGLGNDHDGIIILPQDAKIGQPAKEYFKLDDVIFELEITPNRPDCLSHIGIAREIAAYYGRSVKYPKNDISEVVELISENIKVEIEDKDRCKAYLGRYIKNIKVQESPAWLKKRIEAMGLKSINNIVDISNFVMFEMNQPIHIFDASKIKDSKIIVREAKKNEKLTTLDGVERTLNGELVIADGEKAVAIAGILGGGNSEIDENTKDIFIEVAYFTPENIRKTSKKLGISTDASYRFERGVDKENLETVVDRVAYLVHEVAGGEILRNIVRQEVKEEKIVEITLDMEKLNKFVGVEIKQETVAKILTNLNLEIKNVDTNKIVVVPPSYREDLTRTEDLYEEVIRMFGFENIPAKMPVEDITAGAKDKSIDLVDRVKNILCEIGLNEVINYSFVSEKAIEIIGNKSKNINILNPINDDFKIMRPTLSYSLLSNIRDNFNRNQDNLKFFEVSKVFLEAPELANEEYRIGIAISGKAEKTLWNSKPESYDFYSMKGYVEKMLEKLGVTKYTLVATGDKNFHPGRAADIKIGQEFIGTFGEIHPDLAEKMDIKKDRAYLAELNLKLLEKYISKKIKYEKIVKYPEVTRDFALVLDDSVKIGDMLNELKKLSDIIEKLSIFDIYKGLNIEAGKKSVAISFTFRKKTGTLEEAEIKVVVDKILEKISTKYNGQIRL